jgi:PHP family Zn ribbon phosphoesterase
VCWKRGKFFGVVDARGTSQQCPECGGEVKKTCLSESIIVLIVGIKQIGT